MEVNQINLDSSRAGIGSLLDPAGQANAASGRLDGCVDLYQVEPAEAAPTGCLSTTCVPRSRSARPTPGGTRHGEAVATGRGVRCRAATGVARRQVRAVPPCGPRRQHDRSVSGTDRSVVDPGPTSRCCRSCGCASAYGATTLRWHWRPPRTTHGWSSAARDIIIGPRAPPNWAHIPGGCRAAEATCCCSEPASRWPASATSRRQCGRRRAR